MPASLGDTGLISTGGARRALPAPRPPPQPGRAGRGPEDRRRLGPGRVTSGEHRLSLTRYSPAPPRVVGYRRAPTAHPAPERPRQFIGPPVRPRRPSPTRRPSGLVVPASWTSRPTQKGVAMGGTRTARPGATPRTAKTTTTAGAASGGSSAAGRWPRPPTTCSNWSTLPRPAPAVGTRAPGGVGRRPQRGGTRVPAGVGPRPQGEWDLSPRGSGS